MDSGGNDFYRYDDEDDHADLQENFTVLSEADIRRRQEREIGQVSTTLSLAGASSSILLSNYNWDVDRVFDEWFKDEEKVRKAVGLLKDPAEMTNKAGSKLICGICFETQRPAATSAAACGHRYCNACWRVYIGTSIRDGPGCLMLRCPLPSCLAAVCQDMVDALASDEYKETYRRFLLRSYVEGSKRIKWCPSPGCEFAVDLVMGGGYNVRCDCSYRFCWNCTEEAHRPVDCRTVSEWILKNSSEAENTTWILANSKPCPKCRRPIEKNHGCMHMTCSLPCGFNFCWLCLGPWKNHGSYSSCNSYLEAKKKGLLDGDEIIRKNAKASIQRYTHYYERWASNHKSGQKALEDLRILRGGKLDELRMRQGESGVQMQFIIEAWLQIVECRRVLKWTYTYGYYFPPEEEIAKRHFFEHLQGEAESGLERLHDCAEEELNAHFDSETSTPREEFDNFHEKLSRLTGVTRNYFENLVRAIEAGLEDVSTSAKNTSKKKNKKTETSNEKKKTITSNKKRKATSSHEF